jgi:hypothetical protein
VIRALLVAILAVEGFLLLRPDGALVHAAQPPGYRRANEAEYWWKHSPVHMGCSVASCTRPATRTASYRLPGARGVTWRAYGFCDFHDPPPVVDGLVYRLGHPPGFTYDVALTPVWTETYFLLGVFGFGIWCACMWRWARAATSARARLALLALHAPVVAVLWLY